MTKNAPFENPLRILVVAPRQLLAESLTAALGNEPCLQIAGYSSKLEQAANLARSSNPHVLLAYAPWDLKHILRAVSQCRAALPKLRMVLVVPSVDRAEIEECLAAGVHGCVLDTVTARDLAESISRIADGQRIFPMSSEVTLPARSFVVPGQEPSFPDLKPGLREIEVLQLMALGFSTERVASHLSISPSTVRTHLRNLMSKLRVHTKLEAVMMGMREGWLKPLGDPEMNMPGCSY